MRVQVQLGGLLKPGALSQWTTARQRRAREAASIALSKTALAAQRAEVDEMRKVFDRPTPFALDSVAVKVATVDKLEARISIKDFAGKGTPPIRFLGPQIAGGGRSLKGSERSLQAAGILPRGMYAVPAVGAKLDAYGNMNRGQLVQILSQLKAQAVGGFDRGISGDPKRRARALKRAGAEYFAGRPRGRTWRGVWRKEGRRIVPVLVFVRPPRYKSRFFFFAVAKQAAEREFPRQFDRALASLPLR